jgi:hypothetical protein
MNAPHDNTTIKVSNSFNGKVVLFSGVYVGGFGSIVLLIFALNFWAQAVALVGVLVYGILAAAGLVIAIGVAYLGIRFVVHPAIDARERNASIMGQQMRNRVVWTQENAVIYESMPGTLTVVPLFPNPAKMIEAPKPFERPVDNATVIELYDKEGLSVKAIAEDLETTTYKVNQIVTKAGVMRKKGD